MCGCAARRLGTSGRLELKLPWLPGCSQLQREEQQSHLPLPRERFGSPDRVLGVARN